MAFGRVRGLRASGFGLAFGLHFLSAKPAKPAKPAEPAELANSSRPADKRTQRKPMDANGSQWNKSEQTRLNSTQLKQRAIKANGQSGNSLATDAD